MNKFESDKFIEEFVKTCNERIDASIEMGADLSQVEFDEATFYAP